jgi:hypothetical protein
VFSFLLDFKTSHAKRGKGYGASCGIHYIFYYTSIINLKLYEH